MNIHAAHPAMVQARNALDSDNAPDAEVYLCEAVSEGVEGPEIDELWQRLDDLEQGHRRDWDNHIAEAGAWELW